MQPTSITNLNIKDRKNIAKRNTVLRCKPILTRNLIHWIISYPHNLPLHVFEDDLKFHKTFTLYWARLDNSNVL